MGCTGSSFTIGVIVGSIRAQSNNRGLFKHIQTLKPEDCNVKEIKIDDLPLFNEDLQIKNNNTKKVQFPSSVERLRNQVRQLDAVVFVSPEYNGGISGPLKNAYDWLSRDHSKIAASQTPPIKDKKIGIIGASYVSQNGVKDVKKMIEYLNPPLFQQTFYTKLGEHFDKKGNLIDPAQKKRLGDWALKFWKFALPQQPKQTPPK